MKESDKSGRALRPSVAKIPKGEKSQPSKVNGKSRPLPDVVRSKNSLGWYVALYPKPLKEKTACVPQVKWKCPPRFNLNPCWYVVAGEGSQEAKAQMLRARVVLEVPPSPSDLPGIKGEHCDDGQIPIIPIIPVEEHEEMSLDASVPASTINSQLPASSNLPVSQGNAVGPQRQLINEKSLPDKLCELEGSDLEVALAAAATAAAIMESKEQIDTELLIKFLSNPEMVRKLIDENKSSCKPGGDGTPAAAPEPASVDKPCIIDCSAQLSRSIPYNTNTYTKPNQSITLPCTKVEAAGGIHVGNAQIPMHTSRPGMHSHIHQTAGVKQVIRPVMPASLRSDEGIMKRWNSQYGPPDITKQQDSSSKPSRVAVIKQMISKYGAADAGGVNPRSPQLVATPIPGGPRMEGMAANILSEVGISDHRYHQYRQWGPNPPSLHTTNSTQLKAAMPLVMPPRMESQPSLPASPGITHFAPFSPITTQFGHRFELNHNSPHGVHGQMDETQGWQEHKLLKLGQPGNYLHGQPMLGHKTTPIEINSIYWGPFKYFNSTMDFRAGSPYPYGHETSEQRRAGGVEEVPTATKRMKFSE